MTKLEKATKIDTENYPKKTTVVKLQLESILRKAKMPSFSLEEPFSHNITDLARCLRQRYYKWVGIPYIIHPEDPPPLYQAWGAAGNDIENQIIEITKRAGIFRGAQIRVRQTNPQISGALDIMIELNGKLMPVEVKSIKTESYYDTCDYICPDCKNKLNSWSKYCKCGFNGSPESVVKWLGAEHKVSWEYYCQIQMYLYLATNAKYMNNGKLVDFDQGFVWYYNKNNGEMTLHLVDYDHECVEWQFAKTREFEEYLSYKTLPPRDFDAQITAAGITDSGKSDWHCRFCDWRYTCWKEEIEKKNPRYFDFLEAKQ